MILRFSLDLPEDGAYVKITRLLGRTLLEYLQVTPSVVDDLEFVVGELCTNVIRHARSESGRFQVGIEYHGDRVVVTVEDKGLDYFAFGDPLPVGTSRPDFGQGERFGGFGLMLVEKMADKLEFHRTDPQGTTVRAEKELTFQSQAAADAAARLGETEGGEVTVNTGE